MIRINTLRAATNRQYGAGARQHAAILEFASDAAAAAELELAADAASFLVETPHGVMSAREALDSDLPIWSMR